MLLEVMFCKILWVILIFVARNAGKLRLIFQVSLASSTVSRTRISWVEMSIENDYVS